MPATTRRRWAGEAIEAAILPVVHEAGRMPTRTELARRGLGGAYAAMQRLGGIAAWRERLGAVPAGAGPCRDDVAVRAYFIARERGGDPVANWLAAEAELGAPRGQRM